MQQQQQARIRYMNAHFDNVIALTSCRKQQKAKPNEYLLKKCYCTYTLLNAAAATTNADVNTH